MIKKYSLSLLSFLLILGIVGCSSIVMAAGDLTSSLHTEESPGAVVEGFYDWMLGYIGDRGPSGEFHNPVVARAYRDSQYLTQDFINRLDQLLDSGQPLNHDPLLCAQDVPEFVRVAETTLIEDRAEVNLETSFPNHAFTVILIQVDGQWLMDDIRCR